LQTKISDLEMTSRIRQEETIVMKTEFDERVAKQAEAHRVQLELSEKRVGDMQTALVDARGVIKNQEEQLAIGKQEIIASREELREARLPDPAHKETVDMLTRQCTALRVENTELVLRSRTIDARYRIGDLVRCQALLQCAQKGIHSCSRRTKKRKSLLRPLWRLRSRSTSKN
jgi:hypothetical protein